MNIIEKKVQQLMNEYADGGAAYFDALDMCLRGEWQIILQLLMTTFVGQPIVVQGGFGLAVKNLMSMHNLYRPGILWIKSSPRKDEILDVWSEGNMHSNPVFLDDSCYSGKTIDAVDDYLMEKYGLNVQYTNVIYDGTKGRRQPSLNSFFRYYDHY